MSTAAGRNRRGTIPDSHAVPAAMRRAPRIIDPATLCTACGVFAAVPGALSSSGALVSPGWCRCCLCNYMHAVATHAGLDEHHREAAG